MLPPQLSDGVNIRGLHWRQRTFDISIGPEITTVTLSSGAPFAVEAPEGKRVLSAGSPLVLKTRRPDQTPTDNIARCASAQASDQEPGMYAEAALDGSQATKWVPMGRVAHLTVDLGKVARVSKIMPSWTDRAPKNWRVLVAKDGDWREVSTDAQGLLTKPVHARYEN